MVDVDMEKRRSKVTPEHAEEARKLRALWEQEKPRLQEVGLGAQDAFGDHYGIGNQAAVGHFLKGNTLLSLKAAVAFARGLGCGVGDFSPRLAAQLKPGDRVPPPSTAAGRIEMLGHVMAELDEPKQRFLLAFAEQVRGPQGDALIDFLRRLPPRLARCGGVHPMRPASWVARRWRRCFSTCSSQDSSRSELGVRRQSCVFFGPNTSAAIDMKH